MGKPQTGDLSGLEPAQRIVFLGRYVGRLPGPPAHKEGVNAEIRIGELDLDRP